LAFYFALDSGLPVGSGLEFGAGALKKTTVGCNVWAVTTSLDVATFTTATVYDKGTASAGVCTYKKALAANTVYALVFAEAAVDTDHEVTGTVGPFTVDTWANGKTNGVKLDTNNVFDTVTTLAAPATGLSLTVTKATANGKDFKYLPSATPAFTFKWSFDSGLHPSNETAKGKTPFVVK